MRKKVMIAEDECIIAELFKRNCIEFGHDVLAVVHSGEDAINKAFELSPDVIFMDISMEYRTAGIDACKKIKEKYPHIMIFFVTAYPQDTYWKELADISYNGYINKADFESVFDII